MRKNIFILFGLLISSNSWAQNSDPTTIQSLNSRAPSSASAQAWSFNVKSNFDGPTFSKMDGRRGDGTALNWKNSIRLGYALARGMSAEAVPVLQFRSANPSRAQQFEFTDPYLALKQADIFATKQRGYDFSFEARYYVPISAETKRELGSTRDKGNGRILGRMTYTQSLGETPLELVSDLNYFHHLSRKFNPKAISGVVEVYNFLNWKVNGDWTPYLSYKNVVQRFHNGSGDPWTKSHTVGVGAKWQATRSLSLDPALDWPFVLGDTQIRLEAIYRFI